MLTRRTLLHRTGYSAAGLLLSRAARFTGQTPLLEPALVDGPPVRVPADFIGLGYEMSSVAPIGLLSKSNTRYLHLFGNLAPQGVLRVGGIVADYTRYNADGTIRTGIHDTVVTRQSLEQFAEFLRTTGWQSIWSLNFAQGTIAEAVEEARAVSSVLGSRLLALEIGNEVDAYGNGAHPFRPSPYTYETYRAEYSKWHAAITQAVPGAAFAAPDTTTHAVGWDTRMAEDAHGDVQLLTTHYYRDSQQHGTAEELLTPDPKLAEQLMQMHAASQKSGIPWRMCECNSFFGGGRPGVSDTFVGALWTLDYMLLLASGGCAGVNMETGVNQLGFVSSYSPVQDDGHGVNFAGAPYYGMLAFATAFKGCGQAFPLHVAAQGQRVTAYALGSGGKPRAAVIVNRDASVEAKVSLTGLGLRSCTALRLTAPSADSKTGVQFGGAAVQDDGRWSAATAEPVRDGHVKVPAMSAVVLRA